MMPNKCKCGCDKIRILYHRGYYITICANCGKNNRGIASNPAASIAQWNIMMEEKNAD